MITLDIRTASASAPPRSSIVRDSVIVMSRELRPTLRDPFSVFVSLTQPLILLALFGPLLSNVYGGSDGVWNWFVPGVLVMIAIFGTSMTGRRCLPKCNSARTNACWSRHCTGRRC